MRNMQRTTARRLKADQRRQLAWWRRQCVRVVDAYAEVARPLMLEHMRPESCIAATRITVDVLAVYDVPARPCRVILSLHNRAWMELAERLGRPPTIDEQVGGPAWSVGVGVPGEPDDPRIVQRQVHAPWDGHLVALALSDTVLLDASIDQASRPQHDLEIPPSVLAMGVPEGFTDGKAQVVGERRNGAVVAYSYRAEGPSWEDAPDWDPQRWGQVELAIIRAMEAKGVRLS
jgi:hypothetical protein